LLIATATLVAGFFAGLLLEKRMRGVEAQGKTNFSAAATAGEKNTQDVWGPYEVVPDWPKPLTSLPGHDENGKFLDQWSTGKPSTPQFLYMAADRSMWIADGTTAKIIKFDLDGHYLYSWGSQGDFPGALWNVHGMSVDPEGNLYLAEVNNGRAEKFRPRPGANSALLVGQRLRASQ
jgi:hypothetical protein